MLIEVHAGAFVCWHNLVLIVQRARAADEFGGIWEIPSGKLEPEESLTEACRREAYQETGLTLNPLEAVSAIEFWKHKSGTRIHCVQVNFICPLFGTGRHQVQLSEEHCSYQWIALETMGEGLLSPEMQQAWVTAAPRIHQLLTQLREYVSG
jgi:8-oxo-dGTP diphosphatase